jgi:hypothetical protein
VTSDEQKRVSRATAVVSAVACLLCACLVPLAASAASPSSAPAPACRAFGDTPYGPRGVPLLRAQAEFQCKADTSLHVTACLAHLVPVAGQSGTVTRRIVWCWHGVERVPATGVVYLRTKRQACKRGDKYVSLARYAGMPATVFDPDWDQGPWEVCAR